MTRYLFLLLLPLLLFGCGNDSLQDRENPALSVPIRPLPNPDKTELQLEAQVAGRYITSIHIDADDWSAVGPGQEVSLTFRATGMSQVKQFRLKLQIDPVDAIDLPASRFTSVDPFFVPGVDIPVANQLETGAAIFGDQQVEGDGLLGTLSLRTNPTFAADSQVRLQVVLFSIGPSSTERDEYSTEGLQLGVVVNGP
jgi:hypothetical protein